MKKFRRSILNKFSIEELKNMSSSEVKKIVSSYGGTYGHSMEEKVEDDVLGEKNIVLDFKNILIEVDGYEKNSKTVSEVKSNFGSKNYAELRNLHKMLENYWLQELTNCKKIKNYRMISINSKITKKFGMDYSIIEYSREDFLNKKPLKIRGWVKNDADFNQAYQMAKETAEFLIKKINKVNKEE